MGYSKRGTDEEPEGSNLSLFLYDFRVYGGGGLALPHLPGLAERIDVELGHVWVNVHAARVTC